jgi:hypothetical protein
MAWGQNLLYLRDQPGMIDLLKLILERGRHKEATTPGGDEALGREGRKRPTASQWT